MSNEDLFEAVRRDANLSTQARLEMIERALTTGADINATRQYGFTPLHDAVASPFRASLPVADLDIVRALIEHGADVNRSNDAGVVPFGYAVSRNDTDPDATITRSLEVLATLQQAGARPADDDVLASYNCVAPKVFRYLLEIFGNADAFGGGRAPIHAVVSSGRPQLVKILLERGVRLDVVDSVGKTPLGLAHNLDEYSDDQREIKATITSLLEAAGAPARIALEANADLTPFDIGAMRAVVGEDEDSRVSRFLTSSFDSYQELVGELASELVTYDESLPAVELCAQALGDERTTRIFEADADIGAAFFHHGDVVVRGQLRIAGPFVVTGDVSVEGVIRDCGPDSFVAIGGAVHAHGLHTDGEFHVAGDIVVRDVVYGHYNDNVLAAKTIKARLVIEDEHAVVANVESDNHFDIDRYQQGRGDGVDQALRDLLVADVFNDDGLDRHALFERIAKGLDTFK